MVAMVAVAGFAVPAVADEARIEADRPDQTNGPGVVAPGAFQLEVGWTRDQAQGVTAHSIGEGLLRVGLTRRFEVRAGIPTWLVANDGTSTRSGLGDAILGGKLLLAEASGPLPRLGALASVEVPSGNADFRADCTGVQATLAAERDLGSLDVTGNLGVSNLDPGGSSDWTGAASISVGFDLTRRTGGYAEWYALAPRSIGPLHYVNAGLACYLSSRLVVDARIGSGLGGADGDTFFGAGGAWRW
jgi:hypothetical protein